MHTLQEPSNSHSEIDAAMRASGQITFSLLVYNPQLPHITSNLLGYKLQQQDRQDRQDRQLNLTSHHIHYGLRHQIYPHSCIGNENGGKKLSLTDVTKSWFRLWDTSTSCKTLIFTNFSSVICHMSYRKGSLQRYLAGYLAIEFTLEI